jgi:serine/threonine protein phosphatase PrpC
LVGVSKELSKVSVFSKEVNQPTSPINYVLMVVDNIGGIAVNELELTETELFVNRLFVQGDYKQYADKFQLNRDDLKKILYEASAFLSKNKIPCTIALILKSIDESRDVYISRTGTSSSYIINSQSLQILNDSGDLGDAITQPGLLEKPQVFSGKLKKEDTILLCSENLSAVLDRNFIQRMVLSSKSPEEVCKKLLHSASGTGRNDNISVAAYNGTGTKRNPKKERISIKTLLLIIIPLFLILIGWMIFKLSSETKEKSLETTSPINTIEPTPPPPVIEKKNNIQQPDTNTPIPVDKNIVNKTADNVKKIKYLNFIVNGSVVMISNWESVKQEILSINWDNGITDKKKVHKYPDYTSIPSSVKVTYKDHSIKSYRIK